MGDGDYWHKGMRKDRNSLNTIMRQAADSVCKDVPTNVATFLARKVVDVEQRMEQACNAGKPSPYRWRAFQRYFLQEESGLVLASSGPLEDCHDIPADNWLVVDGMFPEVLYGKPDAYRQQQVLFTLLSRYERLDLKLDSGRTWIILHPEETRETLRAARRLYDFEKRAFLGEQENLELHMQEALSLPEDWCKELEDLVVADAKR